MFSAASCGSGSRTSVSSSKSIARLSGGASASTRGHLRPPPTPTSIVSLLVEIPAPPFHGRILDLACGSGGRFVQSARFVSAHRKNSASELSIHGQERVDATVRLARRNLAVHGLEGAIKQGSAYYEDSHHAVGPNLFYTVTLPCTLWFLDRGKKGTPRADTVLFLDARHIYRQIDRAPRDWTPAQIGFLANVVRLYRGEAPGFTLGGGEARAKLEEVFAVRDVSGVSGRVGVPPAVSRVSRETSDVADAPSVKNAAQRRGVSGGTPATAGGTPTLPLRYRDVSGLCKAATLAEIEAQGWSLNPGRYVGVAPGEEVSGEDFKAQLEVLNEELETLNAQARELEETIAGNVAEILEA